MTVWILMSNKDENIVNDVHGGRVGVVVDAFVDKGPADLALAEAVKEDRRKVEACYAWHKRMLDSNPAPSLIFTGDTSSQEVARTYSAQVEAWRQVNPNPYPDHYTDNSFWLLEIE
jgi:hypothetical protein